MLERTRLSIFYGGGEVPGEVAGDFDFGILDLSSRGALHQPPLVTRSLTWSRTRLALFEGFGLSVKIRIRCQD